LARVAGWEVLCSSLLVCEGGRLELLLLLGVCFSMNTAISSSNSISRAWTKAWISAVTWPSAHRRSKRSFRVAKSSRRELWLTLAMAIARHRA